MRRANRPLRIHMHGAAQEASLARLLRLDERQLRALGDATVVSDARHALVLRIKQDDGPALYWKEFRRKSWYESAKEFFRAPKSLRAWRGAELLREAGLGCAPLVACGHSRRIAPWAAARSFIVTEEITGAQRVADYLRAFPEQPAQYDLAIKRNLMREIGRTTGRMHNAGLFHRDLRVHNILFRVGQYERPEIFLIDTDSVLRRPFLQAREASRNLMQLGFAFLPAMSLTDRMRILDAYARERRLSRTERRRIAERSWRWVYRRLLRRIRRKALGHADATQEAMAKLLTRINCFRQLRPDALRGTR